MPRAAPRIAVLLDENTSGDGTRYEAAKAYFDSVAVAGGLPFGIPYLAPVVEPVCNDFGGLLCVGGRFAYPSEWYAGSTGSKAPPSARLDVERRLMEGFLARRKPVLGICAGMQMLACLHGCRLTPDLRADVAGALDHDGRGLRHLVRIVPGSTLASIVGQDRFEVNTFHREAVVETSARVRVCALADDGIVEAIEIPDRPFAIGLQWHQELLAGEDHPGQAVFARFVAASA